MKNKKIIALLVAFLFMFNCIGLAGVDQAKAAANPIEFTTLKGNFNEILGKMNKSTDKTTFYNALDSAIEGKGENIQGFNDIATDLIEDAWVDPARELESYMDAKNITKAHLIQSLHAVELFMMFPENDRQTMVGNMKNGNFPSNLDGIENQLVTDLDNNVNNINTVIENSTAGDFDLRTYAFVLKTLQKHANTKIVSFDNNNNIKITIPNKIGDLENPSAALDKLKNITFKGFTFPGIEEMTNRFTGAVNTLTPAERASLKATLTNHGLVASPPPSGGGGGVIAPPVAKDKEIKSSDGGKFTNENTTVDIDPNSFDFADKLKVKIVKVDNTSALPVGDNETIIGDAVEITKDVEGVFSKRVKISLKYDKSKVDLTKYDLFICWLDETTNKWIKLDDNKVEPYEGVVSGYIDHFTKFALIGFEKEEPVLPGELTDITGHWAEKNIRALIDLDAIGGYADNTFKPDNKITRAEFAKILVKAYDLDNKNGKVFADTVNHWAMDVIAAAQSHGIVSGYSATTFGPDDVITREQMAAMVVNAAGLKDSKGQLTFADKDKVSAWAIDVVTAASAEGLIGGYPDNTFKPQNNATRAEAASVIVRALAK